MRPQPAKFLRDNRFNRIKNQATLELDAIKNDCHVGQISYNEVGEMSVSKRDYSGNIHNPKLGTVSEFMKDLWQEEVEDYSKVRQKIPAVRLTLSDKRNLRRWFSALDADGSGEVTIEELEDPLISTGILTTKDQVIACMKAWDSDDSGTVSFDEFVEALYADKHTNREKLQMLQDMSNNDLIGMETLIGFERRRTLNKLVVHTLLNRSKDIDDIWKKERKMRNQFGRYCNEIQEEFQVVEEKHGYEIENNLGQVKAAEDVFLTKRDDMKSKGLLYSPSTSFRIDDGGSVGSGSGSGGGRRGGGNLMSSMSVAEMTKSIEDSIGGGGDDSSGVGIDIGSGGGSNKKFKDGEGWLLSYGLKPLPPRYGSYGKLGPKTGFNNGYKIPKKKVTGYRKNNLRLFEINDC